jgi:hypothetical protein
MNTHAVHESVRLLPPDSAAYGPKTRPKEAHERWAKATNDPCWAWRIARGYNESQEPLPPSIREPHIRRAYRYLGGNRDDAMAMTLGIRTSIESGMTRSVLQGFLCARDISLEGIASLLGMKTEVVSLFEGLFFNVRNREGTFVLNTIFPQTRLGAVREAELDYSEVDQTLMRVGRDYGWKAVAQLAGLLAIEDADETSETMLADMEKTTAANARMLARAGHLNRKESPGIRHGKSLIMRAKKELVHPQLDDDRLGLGSVGMGASLLEHFRRIMDTDTQYRLALQREAAMGQLEKTAVVERAE